MRRQEDLVRPDNVRIEAVCGSLLPLSDGRTMRRHRVSVACPDTQLSTTRRTIQRWEATTMDYPTENEAVWKAFKEIRRGQSFERLAQDGPVGAKSFSRWAKDGLVPDRNLEAMKVFVEERGVDWRKFLSRQRLVYDIKKDYWESLAQGPQGLPARIPEPPLLDWSFLGKTIDSPIGVPASVATADHSWIRFWFQLHFTVLTYKTVRAVNTKEYSPHPFPHVVRIPDWIRPFEIGDFPSRLVLPAVPVDEYDAHTLFTLANSVGMPSPIVADWKRDIALTKDLLPAGCFLIVSVVGTGSDPAEMLDNFVECACEAAELQPDAIELNASCPNVFKTDGDIVEGALFEDPRGSAELLTRVAKELRKRHLDVPVLLKIGYLSPEKLEALVERTRKLTCGYTAINTMPTQIYRAGQEKDAAPYPFFSRYNNPIAGVSGIAIQIHSLETVRNLDALRNNKSEFAIVGVGGVSTPEHVLTFLKSGADVVQTCTAAMFDRCLAVNTREHLARSGYNMRLPHIASGILELSSDGRFPDWHDRIVRLAGEAGIENLQVSEVDWIIRQQLSQASALRHELAASSTAVRTRTANPSDRVWIELLRRIHARR